MSINASMIVDVTARAVRAGSGSLEFNGLLLTKNLDALSLARFESVESVADWFGEDSLEYAFASAYFTADVMKTRTPSAVYIARDCEEASKGFIKSGELPDLGVLKKIQSGSFTIAIGGESVVVSALDLTEATSYDDAASKISQKIAGTTGKYDANANCFFFHTSATGVSATIGFATGSDADKLCLTANTGAVLYQGENAKSPDKVMDDIIDVTRNFVTFTTVKEITPTRAVGFAKWVSKKPIGYIYLPFTENENALTVGDEDLASVLDKAGVSYTAPIYGDLEYAAFYAGMIASTDWNATNGVKNYAFKQSAFLPALVSSNADAEILKNKGYNFIGNFATRNADFQITYRGEILGKTFHFIDEVAGMIWLANEVQRVLMDGLVAVNRVPYNPSGYNMIRAWMTDPIDAGLNNGFIQEGVKLSGVQKTQLIEAVGADVSKEVETKGYYLVVKEPTPEVRSNRGTPIVQLYFTYGGAVLKIDPTVTAYL